MRNPMPLQWIEEAEERRVLAEACIEPVPHAPRSTIVGEAAVKWRPRLGDWLAAWHPLYLPAVRLQPVPISRPMARLHRPDDGDGRCSDW